MQREKYTLGIADIIFNIDTYPDEYTRKMFSPYIINDADITDAVNIKCTRTKDSIPEPSGKLLTEREIANWYHMGEGAYTVVFKDPSEDFVSASFTYDNSSKSAEVLLMDVAQLHGTDDTFFLYNILEYVFRLALIFSGGFAVHASSIVHDGYGVAFSAESGTGKSTHTALWQKVYPDTVILNDDAPAMRQKDGIWYIYGTPWAGTTGINKNMAAPLKALVFLERSDTNTIRTLSALEGINRIFEAITHPVSDELMGIVLNTLSSFISASRMCVLGCNMTDDAPKTVKEYLYK